VTKEQIRVIECECGNTEEFYADMPRSKSQYFIMIDGSETEDNNATYVCPDCSSQAVSTTE
jgi:Zn finger protein HypA/HybF involved in hydrogenase expression